MKKGIFLLLCTLCVNTYFTYAVNYYSASSWGYAGTGVTGGGSATPTLVNSESQLKNALKSNNRVIIITQDITVSAQVSIDGKNHITLMALPGKKLISTNQTKNGSGTLSIKNGSSNIILRNIIFEGPGAFDCDGKDNLTVTGSQNIWVDHCDFQDGCDGNFDINGTSDNITVSWCRFRYLKAPRPKEPDDPNEDHTDDHRFSNLVGSSASDKPTDGTYNITYAYCWWDQGCKQRMTRCRNCELHFLNCYWNSSVADYYVGPEKAKCYFEGCTFSGKANSASKIWNVYGQSTNSCKFVNCTGNLPSNSGSVSAPSYSYDQLSAAVAKNHVTNSECGSGATLTVTNTGEVSSSCDTEVDPTPVDSTIVSGQYCIDMTLGEEPNTVNEGIPAGCALLAIMSSLNADKGSKWEEGFLFWGTNTDFITFDFSAYDATITSVEFDVTIPNWAYNKNTVAYHWGNASNTNYTISSADTETVSLTAPANAKSFTIQRSASTGTRISRVCFQINSNGTTTKDDQAVEQIPLGGGAHKIIREGQLLIERENKVYNLMGRRVR